MHVHTLAMHYYDLPLAYSPAAASQTSPVDGVALARPPNVTPSPSQLQHDSALTLGILYDIFTILPELLLLF